MTQLETHLLSALKDLETQFNAQHSDLQTAHTELRKLCAHILKENKTLKEQTSRLVEQVTNLSTLLKA